MGPKASGLGFRAYPKSFKMEITWSLPFVV